MPAMVLPVRISVDTPYTAPASSPAYTLLWRRGREDDSSFQRYHPFSPMRVYSPSKPLTVYLFPMLTMSVL